MVTPLVSDGHGVTTGEDDRDSGVTSPHLEPSGPRELSWDLLALPAQPGAHLRAGLGTVGVCLNHDLPW